MRRTWWRASAATALPAAVLVAVLAWPSVREPAPVTPSELPTQQLKPVRPPVAGAPARPVRPPAARSAVPTPVAAVTASPEPVKSGASASPAETSTATPQPTSTTDRCVVPLLEPLGC